MCKVAAPPSMIIVLMMCASKYDYCAMYDDTFRKTSSCAAE